MGLFAWFLAFRQESQLSAFPWVAVSQSAQPGWLPTALHIRPAVPVPQPLCVLFHLSGGLLSSSLLSETPQALPALESPSETFPSFLALGPHRTHSPSSALGRRRFPTLSGYGQLYSPGMWLTPRGQALVLEHLPSTHTFSSKFSRYKRINRPVEAGALLTPF